MSYSPHHSTPPLPNPFCIENIVYGVLSVVNSQMSDLLIMNIENKTSCPYSTLLISTQAVKCLYMVANDSSITSSYVIVV